MPHTHDTPIRWTNEEDTMLTANYGKSTYEQIAEMLPGRTWMAVRHHANLLGLTGTSNLGRKFCADKHFFAVPNILNSYWAGFLAADGNIRGNRLSVGLATKDTLHVERLRRALGYTGKVYCDSKVAHLQVACSHMVEDLKRNFNITERKSLTLEPPLLTDENLIRAFIVGVIDGDGSITSELKQGKYLHPRITIYGTQALLKWIQGHFDLWVPPTSRVGSGVHKRPAGELYVYRVTAGRAIGIAKRLMQLDLPRLERKWSVFNDYTSKGYGAILYATIAGNSKGGN